MNVSVDQLYGTKTIKRIIAHSIIFKRKIFNPADVH